MGFELITCTEEKATQAVKSMKYSTILVATLGLLVAGCQKPNQVELTDDDSALEVEIVENSDLNLERTPVDSAAILPKDEDKFAGQIYLSAVKTQSARGVESRLFSKVLFEDRTLPVQDSIGRRRGFSGINLGILGSVKINGQLMFERPHRVGNTVGGVEYVRELSSIQPRERVTWQIASLQIGTFESAINTPELLQVYSPVGGAVIPKNQDLELRWTGKGEMMIILSTGRFDGSAFVTTPIVNARVKKGEGRARLSKKVLRALPDAAAYVFTFVLLNREEKVALGRFNGKVLVQASSIYNSVVTLN